MSELYQIGNSAPMVINIWFWAKATPPPTCQLDNFQQFPNIRSVEEVSVAEFKANFSQLLQKVRRGEKVAIQYGRRKETVALLVPSQPKEKRKRRLGILKDKVTFRIRPGFKMTEEELLKG